MNSELNIDGILWGSRPKENGNFIRIDNGIDNVATKNNQTYATTSRDDSFIIRLDGRLGKLVATDGFMAPVEQTDDDGIATYVVPFDQRFIVSPDNIGEHAISGFLGNTLRLKIQTTPNLQSSNYYFDLLGSTGLSLVQADNNTNSNVKFIDSLIHIEGVTTGYSLSIPIRYIKI